MDASNLLKPVLGKEGIKFIGSTTFKEFRTIFEQDRALSRRFQKVDLVEPSVQETIKILEGLKKKYEQHHDLKYSKASLKAQQNFLRNISTISFYLIKPLTSLMRQALDSD